MDLVSERGSENTLQPGTYTFDEGVELLAVVDMLEHGIGASRYKVTIPEGLAITQIKARLDEDGEISGTRLRESHEATARASSCPRLLGSR